MAGTIVDDIVTKINQLSEGDREELLRRLSEPDSERAAQEEVRANGKKSGYVHPNTVWVREHSSRYRGMHVALQDGKFIAAGRDTKEADRAAREKGFTGHLVTYIPREKEIIWGGW